MATSGPGIDAPGEWFLADVNTTSLVIGKSRALVIDNSTSPPTVSINGGPVGSSSAFFGTGADGNATISVNASLTRDTYYNNLTINNGITLDAAGFRVFVKGTLTLTGTGKIANNGLTGVAPVGATGGVAGAAISAQVLGGSGAGGAGSDVGAAAVAGGNTTVSVGADGGAGGAGGAGGTAGAAGGTAGDPTTVNGGIQVFYDVIQAERGRDLGGTKLTGGAGGGGGGAGAAVNGGGGGGSGGGVLVVCASTITGTGTIEANGGAGGAGVVVGGANGSGGGGGGGGGAVAVLYKTFGTGFASNKITADGGAGGLGETAGTVGPNGTVVLFAC